MWKISLWGFKTGRNWREIFELRAAANNSTWSLSNFDKEKKSFEWRRKKIKIEWKVWFFSTIFIFHSFLVQKFLWSVCVGFGSFYIMLKNLFFPPLFQWIDVKQNFEVEIDSRRNWESDGQHETAQPAWMKIFLSSIYEKKLNFSNELCMNLYLHHHLYLLSSYSQCQALSHVYAKNSK